MSELGLLSDLLIIFVVALLAVTALRRIGIPPIAGFIVSGILVGPGTLGLIRDVHEVELLAEVGVVLLLFGIGLELSLDRLKRLWKPVVLGGSLQVGITVGLTVVVVWSSGLSWRSAALLGFIIAVSSTAIVLRALVARGEVDAPHGRLTLGILIFQDLMVVPMMLMIPILAGDGLTTAQVVLPLVKACAVIVGVVVAGRLIVPRLLLFISRTRERDLFVLTVFVIVVGTAWVASLAGISLALGAFLAGLVVAASEYRHQAMSDLIPFRDVLTSVFFVSIGMLLDPAILWSHAAPIGLLLACIVVGKFMIVFLVAVALKLPIRVSILAGASLAQVGEFAFVMLKASEGTGLVEDVIADPLMAAFVLSMLLTPLALHVAPKIAAGVGGNRILIRLLGVQSVDESTDQLDAFDGHVIISGYGPAGEKLARALRDLAVPYLVVDLNPDNVRRASANGDPAYFGDAASTEVMEKLGAHRASVIVILINDATAEEMIVRAARRVSSHAQIIARTTYQHDRDRLVAAGATEVIAAEVEAALRITERVAQLVTVRQ